MRGKVSIRELIVRKEAVRESSIGLASGGQTINRETSLLPCAEYDPHL